MFEILSNRITLLAKAIKSPELQAVEIELCRRNILYWFKTYTYTDRNLNLYKNDEPNVLPFIPYPFQEELITEVRDSIVKGEPVFIDKSRQMGISWVIMGIFVYGWIFHNHKYLVISQKQDDVDKLGDMKSLFEKARFMIANMPEWMLPKGFNRQISGEHNKYMNISRPDGSGSITGESANPNASRGGTYNAIFADEFAFQSNASTINKAMTSATPCRIYASTPNGKGNEHYRMKLLAEEKIDRYGNVTPPRIKGLRYHWSEHPLYTQERYENKIKGMDSVTIAQELEIDYDTAVQGRVYPEFAKEPVPLVYDNDKPLYIAIDNSHGGTDPHAVIVVQPDGNYFNIIDCIEFKSTPEDAAYYLYCIPKMILNDIMVQFMERYQCYNYKKAIFISDPYDYKQQMGNSTILEDYRKAGINLNAPEEKKKEEQILKTRTNLYRFRYNENCVDMASAILNARYPERKEDSNSTKAFTLPVHNRTSHYRTALEYFTTYYLENPLVQKKRILEDTRVKKNVLGQLYSRPIDILR